MMVSNLLIARFSILIILCVATDIFWSATGLNSDCGTRGWLDRVWMELVGSICF